MWPYIDFRGFVEGTIWMHMVIEDNNPHHHPHTKEERVFTVEPACVFPFKKGKIQNFHNFQLYPLDRIKKS